MALKCDVCGCLIGLNQVSTYCLQCQLKLCGDCHREHDLCACFTNHCCVNAEGLETDIPDCPEHPGVKPERYCNHDGCRRALCVRCVIRHSKTHDVSNLSDVLASWSSKLTISETAFENKIKLAEERKRTYTEGIEQLQVAYDGIVEDVREHKQMMIERLNRQANGIISSLNHNMKQQKQIIKDGLDSVEIEIENIQNKYEQTKKSTLPLALLKRMTTGEKLEDIQDKLDYDVTQDDTEVPVWIPIFVGNDASIALGSVEGIKLANVGYLDDGPRYVYDRATLLKLRDSPLSKRRPAALDQALDEVKASGPSPEIQYDLPIAAITTRQMILDIRRTKYDNNPPADPSVWRPGMVVSST